MTVDLDGGPRRYGVEDVLRAATVGGAINAGRQDEVGTIEVGKRADLVLIALDEVTTRLCGSDVAAVVNYGGATAVDTVFIDGRVKKWGGELVGVDYAQLAREGEASRTYLLERFRRHDGRGARRPSNMFGIRTVPRRIPPHRPRPRRCDGPRRG